MSGTKLPASFVISKDFKLTYYRPLCNPIKKTATTVDKTTFVAVFRFWTKNKPVQHLKPYSDKQIINIVSIVLYIR